MGKFFDPFPSFSDREMQLIRLAWRLGGQYGRNNQAKKLRKPVETEFGPEVADAVETAIKAGRDPKAILERAKKDKAAREERERLLANPPPLHGSATWAKPDDLAPYLKGREAFDNPRSILLGAYAENDQADPTGFVHWDKDGHLLTVAPTRSGKALTTIIPNLLRYRGSCVVFDPKGELYAATSKWRSENVGPVYRLAPFDTGTNPATAGFPRHRFNPLEAVKTQADARYVAEMMFPRDPKSPAFFTEDAVAFVTALILHTKLAGPPSARHIPAVRQATTLPIVRRNDGQSGAKPPERSFNSLLERMAKSQFASVRDAAHNIAGKSPTGLANLRDTLNAKLALWSDDSLQVSLMGHDFDFEGLKDRPATVYLDVPFHYIEPYAPWIRVVLKSALDAMLRNPAKPDIPVLFILDEFAALGPFPEFRNAIRTHAGAGVRLWFFLQDVAALEENYPNGGWRPFFNCSVRQYFGVDETAMAELVSRALGQATVAYRATTGSASISTQAAGSFEDGPPGLSLSSSESVQFVGRPLMTPDEVTALMSDWRGDGWRTGIVHMRGPRPFQVQLVVHDRSPTCRERVGAYRGAS